VFKALREEVKVLIKIINRLDNIDLLFDKGQFNLEKWTLYINNIYENSDFIFKQEVDKYIKNNKYSWDKDFLPIINNVYNNEKIKELNNSFLGVTNNLNEIINITFNKKINTDIVLYLGLCNGAGWVTKINDKTVILLGAEKILELNWFDLNSIQGLIYHELGHVYHMQHGKFINNLPDNKYKFVYQLFIEGVAIYFTQSILNDFDYYHQDKDDWKNWCDDNFHEIIKDFDDDLNDMSRFNQRYFGDWCNYKGKSDVGYYLGTKFIHYLINKYTFDEIINFKSDRVFKLYKDFKSFV